MATPEDSVVRVAYEGGDRLAIRIRWHAIRSDQPVEDGGLDTGPTPTEIFVAGLAACVAFYAERYLRRHNLSTAGLDVTCEYRWAENPHRVGAIDISVDAPGLPDENRAAFMRVVEHCTVHNTLRQPPPVRLSIAPARTAAA